MKITKETLKRIIKEEYEGLKEYAGAKPVSEFKLQFTYMLEDGVKIFTDFDFGPDLTEEKFYKEVQKYFDFGGKTPVGAETRYGWFKDQDIGHLHQVKEIADKKVAIDDGYGNVKEFPLTNFKVNTLKAAYLDGSDKYFGYVPVSLSVIMNNASTEIGKLLAGKVTTFANVKPKEKDPTKWIRNPERLAHDDPHWVPKPKDPEIKEGKLSKLLLQNIIKEEYKKLQNEASEKPKGKWYVIPYRSKSIPKGYDTEEEAKKARMGGDDRIVFKLYPPEEK